MVSCEENVEMPLLKIVFLELKKYKESLKNDYKKIRWLEFFGNKQYTSELDDVLIKADNLLNLRNWSKEEKLVYDEITRQPLGFVSFCLRRRTS